MPHLVRTVLEVQLLMRPDEVDQVIAVRDGFRVRLLAVRSVVHEQVLVVDDGGAVDREGSRVGHRGKRVVRIYGRCEFVAVLPPVAVAVIVRSRGVAVRIPVRPPVGVVVVHPWIALEPALQLVVGEASHVEKPSRIDHVGERAAEREVEDAAPVVGIPDEFLQRGGVVVDPLTDGEIFLTLPHRVVEHVLDHVRREVLHRVEPEAVGAGLFLQPDEPFPRPVPHVLAVAAPSVLPVVEAVVRAEFLLAPIAA